MIDAAGEDLVPHAAGMDGAVARQDRKIQLRHTGDDDPVQGDGLTDAHADDLAGINGLRHDLGGLVPDQELCFFRELIPHQINSRVGSGDSIGLEDLG